LIECLVRWFSDDTFTVSRPDISAHLIHFTRGFTHDNAFKVLQKIVRERKLIAGNRNIKGGFNCVCFSEAPLGSLSGGLVNENYYSTYSPFGIMVSKKWAFEQGGRPVIYQPESEYFEVIEDRRWRHVTFELRDKEHVVDFTWEREWRFRRDELPFDNASAQIVVPDRTWAERMIREHGNDQDYTIMQYSLVLGNSAELYREPFSWKIVPLA
jgi:hypothetical protein